MFRRPGRLFGSIGVVAVVLLVLSIALGSSGTTEGDPDRGQKIANVTFPLFFVTIAVGIILGIVYVLRRRNSSRRANGS